MDKTNKYRPAWQFFSSIFDQFNAMAVIAAVKSRAKNWAHSLNAAFVVLEIAAPYRDNDERPRMIVERAIFVRANKFMDKESQARSSNNIPSVQIWFALAV